MNDNKVVLFRVLLITIFISLSLLSCFPINDSEINQQNSFPTVAISNVPDSNRENEQISTQTKETISVTMTSSPIPPLSTKTDTLLSLPTLSIEKKNEIIDNFIENNGECELPCWWGYTVGESDWNNIIQDFDRIFGTKNSGNKVVTIDNRKYDGYYFFYMFSNNYGNISWTISGVNGYLYEIYVMTDMVELYGISDFLTKVGEPDNIFIQTYSHMNGYPEYEPYLPFNIVFHYKEDNIIVWYQMQGQKVNDSIIACTNDTYIDIWIWTDDFGQLLIEQYALNVSGGGNDGSKYLREIQYISDFTIESFSELFINNPDACIEVPAEYW